MRDAAVIAWRTVRQYAAAVWAGRADLAVAFALVGGWGLVTRAIAHLTRPDVVWPLSVGLFLLLLCGVQWIGRLWWEGLYQLTRKPDA